MSPAQVGFSPDGRHLIVTTKGSGSTIDVFQVGADGLLSATAAKNPSATPAPFAFTFAPSGRLVVGEAGTSSVSSYSLGADGSLTDPKSLSDGQTALCWIVRIGEFYFVANSGSDTISGYRIAADGQPSLVGTNGIVATTSPGPIDLTSPAGSPYLFAQTGSGSLHAYRVGSDGSLAQIGIVVGLPAGIEGIAST
jgi:6-phosphogluconolactonase (cycloisomerase 2 family)